MTEPNPPENWIAGFLTRNLPWLLMLIAVGYSGYTSGLTRIGDLESRTVRAEQQRAHDREFLNCVVRHLDRVEEQNHDKPPCNLEVPE